jgi:hypothetical protein
MNRGVPQSRKSLPGDCLEVSQRPFLRVTGSTFRAALPVLGTVYALTFASSALGATAAGRSVSAGQASSRWSSGHSGCTAHSGGGTEGLSGKETPAVVKETPSAPTETAAGGASPPSAVTPAVVPAAVPAVLASPPRPTVTASTTPKKAEKRTTKRVTKRPAKKHHPASAGETTERSLARPPLPNKRAAFTG